MKEIKDTCTKGTRILLGNRKRELLNQLISILITEGFEEISIPIIQSQEIFASKVGQENQKMMYQFRDQGDRELCLAPEYTAIIIQLSKTVFKQEKDLKVFYIQECFRGEKPQAGRYRQFTQLGVEIINPKKDINQYLEYLIYLSKKLIPVFTTPCSKEKYETEIIPNLKTSVDITRGLDYYKDGKGFEITFEKLGAQKQICGGGSYEGGIGFALGIDRLLLINSL